LGAETPQEARVSNAATGKNLRIILFPLPGRRPDSLVPRKLIRQGGGNDSLRASPPCPNPGAISDVKPVVSKGAAGVDTRVLRSDISRHESVALVQSTSKDPSFVTCHLCKAKEYCNICIGDNYNASKTFLHHQKKTAHGHYLHERFGMKYSINPWISHRKYVSEVVIINELDKTYRFLRGTAMIIWNLIVEARLSDDEVIETLQIQYPSTSPEQIKIDVFGFIANLIDSRILDQEIE